MTNVTNEVDISKLKTAHEVKGRIADFFAPEDLISLAKNHNCPHYTIYNPAKDEETILFHLTELNEWVLSKYFQRKQCIIPLEINIINFDYNDCKVSATDRVPKQLVAVNDLYILPKHLTQSPPGVYFLCRDLNIVYIGQSTNAANRVQAHWANPEKEFDTVFFVPCPIDSLLRIESALIKFFKPEYNATLIGVCNYEDNNVLRNFNLTGKKVVRNFS